MYKVLILSTLTLISLVVNKMRVWSKFDEQVFQMIGRSRAASSPKDARLTEMSNGVLVSRLALEKEKEPEITNLE